MIQSKVLIYVVVGILLLGSLSGILKNAKDQFFPAERVYTLEEAKLMLKHDSIINYDAELVIEFNVMEKDNERLTKDIPGDSVTIVNGSISYKDSLRAALHRQ
jgi:hypothetical protein